MCFYLLRGCLYNPCGSGWLSRYSDSLRAGRSGDRIPVGARFSAPVWPGPVAYPASCTMGTGSFPGVKRPGRGADHPPASKCRGQERVGLCVYSPSGPQRCVIGRTFTPAFISPLRVCTFILPMKLVNKFWCILYSSLALFW